MANYLRKAMDSDSLTQKIIGAAIEVHKNLGPGLLESIYEEALCYEFDFGELGSGARLRLTWFTKTGSSKGNVST